MGIVFMIVVGGISGLLAVYLQRRFVWRGLLADMLAGMGGAVATGLLVCPGLGLGSLSHEPYSPYAIALVALGAILATALAVVLRRRGLP